MNRRILIASGTLLALFACSPKPEVTPPSTDAPSSAPEVPSNRIDIPALVRKNLGITFSGVERRRVAQTLRVPGAFEWEPLARREYRLALSGHVELLVDHLEPVEAGQVLFRYLSPQWPELLHEIIEGEQAKSTAQANRAVAQAKIVEAEAQLTLLNDRLQRLADAEIRRADLQANAAELQATLPRLRAELLATDTGLENARRTHEHALHRAASASGFLESDLDARILVDGQEVPRYETIEWIEVRALGGGVVEQLHVTDGAFVESPGAVMTIVDLNRVRFRGLALQADLAGILGASQARVLPPKGNGLDREVPVPAKLMLGLDAHPEERTQVVFGKPESTPAWMRPGIAAFLEVELASTDGPTLAIPRMCIVQDGLVHVFFRRDPKDPNKAIRVEADLGMSDGEWVEILSGLSAKDEVVLQGAFELKLASERTGGMPKGGHMHADGTFHAEDDE